MIDLYAITPERSPEVIERSVVRMLSIASAARIAVLLRAKHLPPGEQRALGQALRAHTRARGAKLLISADLELCDQLAADGVQLPERGPSVARARERLGQARLIGASRHDARGLAQAAREGASFATLSPVFTSPDKGEPLGEPAFAALVAAAALPVLALGGIELRHVGGLIRGGAAGIAVIRALFEPPDPAAAAGAFLAEIDHARSSPPSKPGARGL